MNSRLNNRIYILDSLQQIDYKQFLTDELSYRLNCIYKGIGRLQGLGFYEIDFKSKNKHLYKQEIISVLENNDIKVQLADAFSIRLSEDISRKMYIYECMEECVNNIYEGILKGKIRTNNETIIFRKTQIFAKKEIPKLMYDLRKYLTQTLKIDIFIKAGFLAYQFLTIMPYEEDNEILVSILLNCFLRQQNIGADYYIPFARYFIEQDEEWKMAIQHAGEKGDYSVWIRFFINITERAIVKTNQAIMQLEKIHRHTLAAIENQKQKTILQDVSGFIEENPVFVIHDIENEFHTAYNTAAKLVAILEKHQLVKEISRKQRYRVYCYEQYIREILR